MPSLKETRAILADTFNQTAIGAVFGINASGLPGA